MQMSRPWMYGDRPSAEFNTSLNFFIGADKNNQDGFICYPCVVIDATKTMVPILMYYSYRSIRLHIIDVIGIVLKMILILSNT
jgi:hypothetical protein